MLDAAAVALMIGLLLALSVPTMLQSGRFANERNACVSLKLLTSVECTYKSAHTGASGGAPYWGRDIAGLYFMTVVSLQFLEAISLEIARADGDAFPPSLGGTEYPYVGLSSSPDKGYWYVMMPEFLDAKGAEWRYTSSPIGGSTAPVGIAACTDGNVDQYAILAAPHQYGVSGRTVMMVTEQGVVWKRDAGSAEKLWARAPETGVNLTDGRLADAYDTTPYDFKMRHPPPGTPGPWIDAK